MGIKNELIKTDWRGRAVQEKLRVGRVAPRTRDMRWTSLHHHSTYSYLDGYGLPADHIRRCQQLGIQAMALTEHGHVASHVKFEKALEGSGVKGIFGCEFYMSPGKTQRKNHLTVLAENQQGYENILALNTEAYDNFYYEATVSPAMLESRKLGLFVLSGCLGSALATALIGGKLVDAAAASFRRGRSVAQWYKRRFGDHYFLEIQAFPELEQTQRVNKMLVRLSKELKIPLVATMDVHYPLPQDSYIQQILHNCRPGSKGETLEQAAARWGYKVPLCPPSRDLTVVRRLMDCGLNRRDAQEAVLNSEMIAQACKVTMPKLPQLRYRIPKGETRQSYWRRLLREGWAYRKLDALPPKPRMQYWKRLVRERTIIEDKDFIDYLLVVADVVVAAKQHGIPVGPARGSAAGSLLCFLLRITEVDPMLYPNLVFERFIDVSRSDPPDVDLDFASEGRRWLYEYMESKYGHGRVGNIGTFTYYKSKLALDDVGRVFKIPKWDVEIVKDRLIERSSGDLRSSATIEDTAEQFEDAADVFKRHPKLVYAMELEGMVKSTGVHSAGYVVANGPITKVCPIQKKHVAGEAEVREILAFDKYDAEHLNIMKLDFLGLSTMSLIDDCLKWTGMTLEDLYALPLDDAKVIDGFRRNDVVGVFQFDGRAMRSVCGALKPDTFKEICDVNALARPGPLHNGAANEYIDIKNGAKEPERVHPLLDRITADTHYQIVYQEQILRIVTEIGDFSWTHASYIRRIISKKLGEQEFQRQWETFKTGALSAHKRHHGVPPVTRDMAKNIWGNCITSGSYAFNAAHCVSYGTIAYWTMYFKQYHPAIFFAAGLKHLPRMRQKHNFHAELMKDADRHSIEVLKPHVRRSTLTWRPLVGRQAVQPGFSQIPGIAEKSGSTILQYRKQHGLHSWDELQKIKGFGPKTINKIKGFTEHPDPFEIHKLSNTIKSVKRQLWQLGVPHPTHTSAEIPYERGHADLKCVWIGQILHRNLRDLFESNMARTGVALDPKDVRDPHLNEWVIMLGADQDEMVSLVVDRWRYPKWHARVWDIRLEHDIVVARGIKRGNQTARRLYLQEMWVIDPEDD